MKASSPAAVLPRSDARGVHGELRWVVEEQKHVLNCGLGHNLIHAEEIEKETSSGISSAALRLIPPRGRSPRDG